MQLGLNTAICRGCGHQIPVEPGICVLCGVTLPLAVPREPESDFLGRLEGEMAEFLVDEGTKFWFGC